MTNRQVGLYKIYFHWWHKTYIGTKMGRRTIKTKDKKILDTHISTWFYDNRCISVRRGAKTLTPPVIHENRF